MCRPLGKSAIWILRTISNIRMEVLFLLMSCASEEAVKVYNSNPEVTIISHSEGADLFAGYEVTFMATTSDTNHTSAEIDVTWSTDQRTLCLDVTPEVDGSVRCTASLEEGESEIRVQSTDPEGDLRSRSHRSTGDSHLCSCCGYHLAVGIRCTL